MLTLGCWSASNAFAQDAATPTQTVARVEAAMHRVQDDAECFSRKKQEIERVMLLIRDALSQSQGTGTAARDGAAAVESLHNRAALLEREAIACIHREPLLPSSQPQVQVSAASADTHVAAVSETNEATRVIERNMRLGADLTIVVGEQVDGTGRVADNVVVNGIREAAPRLLACFQDVAGSGRHGDMALSFAIGSSGRVSRVNVEGDTLGSASVTRCVRTVGGTLRFGEGTHGADAVISYTLRYGPP